MAISVRASRHGLADIEKRRILKDWDKSEPIWASNANVSISTLKRFWRREKILRSSFINICKEIGVVGDAWIDIAELDIDTSDFEQERHDLKDWSYEEIKRNGLHWLKQFSKTTDFFIREISNDYKEIVKYKESLLINDNDKLDRDNLLQMVVLSNLSYKDEPVILSALNYGNLVFKGKGYKISPIKIKPLDNKTEDSIFCGFSVIDETKVTICFRGTKQKEDLLFGSMIDKINQPSDILSAFDEYVERIWKSLEKLFTLENCRDKFITLTGHSLGGAIATLVAHKLATTCFQPSQLEVFSFGSPRVRKNIRLESKIFRFRTTCDLIPFLPPDLPQYDHPSPEYLITNDCKIYKLEESSKSKELIWYEFFMHIIPYLEVKMISGLVKLLQHKRLDLLFSENNKDFRESIVDILLEEHGVSKYVQLISSNKITDLSDIYLESY